MLLLVSIPSRRGSPSDMKGRIMRKNAGKSQSPQGGAVLPTLPWNSLMILCSSRAKTGHIPQKGIPGIPEVYKNAPFDAITF